MSGHGVPYPYEFKFEGGGLVGSGGCVGEFFVFADDGD